MPAAAVDAPGTPDLDADRTAVRSWQSNGTLLAAGLAVVSLALAYLTGATLTDPAFLVLSLGLVVWQISVRRFEVALEIVLWLWTMAPLIHRVADWRSSIFNPASLTLATAAACSIVLGLACLRGRTRLPTPLLVFVLPALVAIPVAALVGLVLNGLAPALVSAVQTIAPLGAALAVCLSSSVDRVVAVVLRFARWALPVVSAYAIVQWVFAPAWDVFWLRSAFPLAEWLGSSFGVPYAFGIRPWGTVNAPYVLAALLVFLIFTQLNADKTLWGRLGVLLGVFALAITSVRAQWLTAAVVLVIFVLTRRIKLAPLVVFAGAGIGAIALFLPDIGEKIWNRLTSLTDTDTDTSFLARLDIYGDALPYVLSDPLGKGLGSTGSGARAQGQLLSGPRIADSNYLDILQAHGAVFGILLIAALFTVAGLAFVRSLFLGPPFHAWGALAAALPVTMLLGNVTLSLPGSLTLLGIAACLTAPMPATARRRSASPDRV
ncbi:O-antigen ligase family protein [Trujillonella endophytica]|uniref:O-antigen ligase like membrane protein n=1 Tax=Trujillonella endophytica TaxID=673521 RepID=A0A1H8W549_9ACTN|nr:O-antigen ligase family protein [Trujillella endophytica]SEP22775.1 O-antigen ligase like membrane protein [Trujillella endophytica]